MRKEVTSAYSQNAGLDKRHACNTKRKTFDMKVLIVLVFISFFAESLTGIIGIVGGAATFLIPLQMIVMLRHKKIKFSDVDRSILIAFVAFAAVQIIGFRYENKYYLSRSLINFYRTFSCAVVIIFAHNCKFKKDDIVLFNVLTLCLAIIGLVSLRFPNPDGSDKLFGNYNTVGAIFFTLAVMHLGLFIICRKIANVFLIVTCCLIITISRTRSAIILFILLVFGYLILKAISKKKIRYKLIYLCVFTAITVAVFVYYNVGQYAVFKPIDEFFIKYFNKSLDSGRPKLWRFTVQLLEGRIIFGLGTGVSLTEFNPGYSSTHSSYFEILLQNGIVGLCFYIGIIILVLTQKRGNCDCKKMIVFGIVTAAIILFYNAVGLIFLRARSGMGLLQWFLLALPYGTEIPKSSVLLQKEKMRGVYENKCSRSRI